MSLEMRDVTQCYGTRTILDGVSFAVNAGDTVAITGPSGSGKTTFMSVLGLLLPPTSGAVRIDGLVVSKRGRQRDRIRAGHIAWIFQTVNVLGRRTALENVVVALLAQGWDRSKAEPAAHRALVSVGLTEIADQQVKDLSGGEVQRVCVARAIAGNPAYVLADEPTGQLDRDSSDLVLDSLLRARGANTAVLIATHDPSVAQRCDRVVTLESGTLTGR